MDGSLLTVLGIFCCWLKDVVRGAACFSATDAKVPIETTGEHTKLITTNHAILFLNSIHLVIFCFYPPYLHMGFYNYNNIKRNLYIIFIAERKNQRSFNCFFPLLGICSL